MAKSAKGTVLGRNVVVTDTADRLTIEIDKTEKPEPSASGKTMIVATTQGNKRVGDLFIGLNVYRYKDKK